MNTWRAFLAAAEADDVELGEVHPEALTESGERITARVLTRFVDGRLLYCEVAFESKDDPISRWEIRRIANRLRLAPEKYIFRSPARAGVLTPTRTAPSPMAASG